jgi:hypothetical protein
VTRRMTGTDGIEPIYTDLNRHTPIGDPWPDGTLALSAKPDDGLWPLSPLPRLGVQE